MFNFWMRSKLSVRGVNHRTQITPNYKSIFTTLEIIHVKLHLNESIVDMIKGYNNRKATLKVVVVKSKLMSMEELVNCLVGSKDMTTNDNILKQDQGSIKS